MRFACLTFAAAAFSAGAVEPKIEIDAWGGPAPGSAAAKEMHGLPFEYVTPRLTVFLPSKEKRSDSFVLVLQLW